MVTFDDGYRDNYDLAFPVLKRHGVPGVFFITTGFLDQRRVAWWDDISWMVKTSSRTATNRAPDSQSRLVDRRSARRRSIGSCGPSKARRPGARRSSTTSPTRPGPAVALVGWRAKSG